MPSEVSTTGANQDLARRVEKLERDLSDAHRRETATAEVLRVISRSQTDVQPVFDAIVASAVRLLRGYSGTLTRVAGDQIELAALTSTDDAADAAQRARFPLPLQSAGAHAQAIRDRAPLNVPDTETDPRRPEALRAMARARGYQSLAAVPLLRHDEAVGAIAVTRREPGGFTDDEIVLLKTFADQAVIAINNARLFEEVQARTREVTESLKYQTATSEVLGVISRSPSEVQPVLDVIVSTARRLCGAERAVIFQLVDGKYRMVARDGAPAIELERRLAEQPISANRGSTTGRVALEKRVVHIEDVQADPEFTHLKGVPGDSRRTVLGVPLLREGVVLGVIVLSRTEVKRFTQRQIDLVSTFADQAVIAFSNARLFEEVQARTREVTEALEQQTATSEVLRVISSSPGELEPVFQAMLENATRICEAKFALLHRYESNAFRVVALHNLPAAFAEERRRSPMLGLNPGTALGRMAATKQTVQIADVQAEPAYQSDQIRSALLSLGGARTVVAVPMLTENELVGAIVIYRQEVRPFTDKQIALVTSFARQAVIAIENARLLDELQSRTCDLTRSVSELKALGQVGQAVSSSLDPKVVLPRILEHACQMSETGGGAIYVFDKTRGRFDLEAAHNMGEELIAAVREHPIRLGESLVGQCAERREAVQFADLAEAPLHPLIEMHKRTGVRALLAVPLLHQDEVVGALVVRRRRPGAFPPAIVSLMQTFANQSAIAVHNARLFREIEDKSRQLELASQHKSQFVANMSHELRTPLAAMLGYAELLNEGIYGTLPEKAAPILGRVQSNGRHLLGLINTVLDISKIESGQFKLNLSEYALSSTVETVRVATESLAEGKKLVLKTDVAKGLPRGLGDEQRLTQVLLNLVGNAIKFTDIGEVCIVARTADGRFTVTVSDTGPGIPPEERDKVFEKFHQIDNSSTRTKGGTGLGLAIAKDIVEMHGGRIWVESALGQGATFRMEFPVRAKPSEAGAA